MDDPIVRLNAGADCATLIFHHLLVISDLLFLEAHNFPFVVDLGLDLFRVRILEISSLPVCTGRIFDWQQCITDYLTTNPGIERAVTIVWDKRESRDIVEEDLVILWTTASAECPDDILEVEDVDVFAY